MDGATDVAEETHAAAEGPAIPWLPAGIATGVVVGTGVGVLLGQMFLGIGIGVAAGIAAGTALDLAARGDVEAEAVGEDGRR